MKWTVCLQYMCITCYISVIKAEMNHEELNASYHLKSGVKLDYTLQDQDRDLCS